MEKIEDAEDDGRFPRHFEEPCHTKEAGVEHVFLLFVPDIGHFGEKNTEFVRNSLEANFRAMDRIGDAEAEGRSECVYARVFVCERECAR